MFSMEAWRLGTFHGIFAFQQRQASERCCRIVRALFARTPSGIMSMMSCITAARSSRSKWDSTRCFVTDLATPLETQHKIVCVRRSYFSTCVILKFESSSHTSQLVSRVSWTTSYVCDYEYTLSVKNASTYQTLFQYVIKVYSCATSTTASA